MTAGKINYSSDYKSEPPEGFGTDPLSRQLQHAVEHARLERAVIEAAKAWRWRGLTGCEEFSFQIEPLLEAVDALIEFEQKQK